MCFAPYTMIDQDEYDLRTGKWRQLPDAPHVRDHFQAYRYKNRVYLMGGRDSQSDDFLSFNAASKMIDIYDFATNSWTSTSDILPYPGHAGGGVAGFAETMIVAGGR